MKDISTIYWIITFQNFQGLEEEGKTKELTWSIADKGDEMTKFKVFFFFLAEIKARNEQ